MSLDRLIRLAQRTGDRLIVHDPHARRDVVIMSIDAYEALLDPLEEGDQDREYYKDDEEAPWHRTEDILEERYHETIPHEHRHHGRHNRQYRDEDWEEAQYPHEQHPQSSSSAHHQSHQTPVSSQPIQYQKQEDVEVEQHREDRLDEPVFYEEPV